MPDETREQQIAKRLEAATPRTFDGDPLDVMRELVRQVEEREEAAKT